MKKTAKVLALLLVLAMIFSVAACAAKPEGEAPAEGGAAEKVEISFVVCEYSDNTEDYMRKVIDKFQADHENVTINLEMVSWDDATARVNTMIAGNQAPDILNIDSYSQYLEDDLLLEAKDYVSDDLMASFYKTFYDYNVATDGIVYAVPFVASVRNLYYSKAIFEEVGLDAAPATWAEVEDYCKQIKEFYDGAVYPWGMDFTTNEGQSNFSYFAWNFGGGWVDENNNWIVNCEENVEALEFATNMYKNGYTNPNPLTDTRDDMQAMMNEGKIAMMISANFFPALYPDLDLGIAAIPSNGEQESVQLGVQDRLMVFDNGYSEAKLAAIRDFIEYMFTCDDYAEWCTVEGLLPVTSACMEYLSTTNDSFKVYMEALENVKFYPSYLEDWTDVKNAAIDAEQAVATGTKDAKTALDEAQAVAEG